MDFKCNYCEQQFEEINAVVRHLKSVHQITEHGERIKCIVNFRNPEYCNRSYLTFNALRQHAKVCVKSKQPVDEVRLSIESK